MRIIKIHRPYSSEHKMQCVNIRFTNFVTEKRSSETESVSTISLCGGGIPSINTRLQMVFTFIGTFCKYTTCIMRSSWCCWSAVGCGGRATCGWSRLTALLLGRLLGVLPFTESRSMGRAVQWSPMKPESELIRLVRTKVLTDLLLSLVTLRLKERAARTRELHCSNSTC
jgi:hypothetical protein